MSLAALHYGEVDKKVRLRSSSVSLKISLYTITFKTPLEYRLPSFQAQAVLFGRPIVIFTWPRKSRG
jgi:hypothetical protein